jgi:ketosteroid isomerase-like protein
MTRFAVIVTAMVAAAGVCACADQRHERKGRPPAEEDTMGNTPAVETSIIDLERAALEQFGRGDIDGPLALCHDDISYLDPYVERRIDDRTALVSLYEGARGTPQYDRCDLVDPRVQDFGDTAILTYVLVTSGSPMTPPGPDRWKVTAVYRRFGGRWLVVHTHFAIFADTTSRDFEFGTRPVDLGRIEDATLRELLVLEDRAMERWRHGDPWGFWELSAPQVSYFDPETDGRLDGADALRQLYAEVEGKIRYDVSEYIVPRVQLFGDVAVLSYHYRSADLQPDGTAGVATLWNTTEVFARIDDQWRIVHTHWSYARAGQAEIDENE